MVVTLKIDRRGSKNALTRSVQGSSFFFSKMRGRHSTAPRGGTFSRAFRDAFRPRFTSVRSTGGMSMTISPVPQTFD